MAALVVENVCESHGQAACLFGTCAFDALNVSRCLCLPGFEHDVMWTRLENCAQPTWWRFLVYCPMLMCCVLCATYMLLYFPHLVGGARRTLQSVGALIACLTGASVVFLVEGFASRAFFVFFALSIGCLGLALGFFSVSILEVTIVSLRLGDNQRLLQWLPRFKLAFWINALMLPAPWIASLPVCSSASNACISRGTDDCFVIRSTLCSGTRRLPTTTCTRSMWRQ